MGSQHDDWRSAHRQMPGSTITSTPGSQIRGLHAIHRCHHRRSPSFRTGCSNRADRCRPARADRRAGTGAEPGRAGVLVVRWIVLRGFAGTTANGRARFTCAGIGRLDGHRRLRSPGRLLAAQVGRGVCRFCRGRETRVAARDGYALVPGGGLGGARRLRRDRPWQFGAALSRHLGHRTRRAGTIRAARARRAGKGFAELRLSPSRGRVAGGERQRGRRAGHATRRRRHGTWQAAMSSAISSSARRP